MGLIHGQNERREPSEQIRDKEARRFQKTRKTTAKLPEERPEKGRGGRKVERKGQQQGAMNKNNKCSHIAE